VNDGKIRIIEIGHFSCAPCVAAIPGLERLQRQYPGIEVNFLTYGTGVWGNRIVPGKVEADHLADHFTKNLGATFPIGIAMPQWVPSEDGGKTTVVPTPTWHAGNYPQTGKPTFYVIDGKGIVRRVIGGYNRELDESLAMIVEYLLREVANRGSQQQRTSHSVPHPVVPVMTPAVASPQGWIANITVNLFASLISIMSLFKHPSGPATTRREFLSTTSLAVAGTVLGTRQLNAGAKVTIPAESPYPAQAFLDGSSAGVDLMKALALRAVDAARQAGAAHADVRVSERYLLAPWLRNVYLETELTFGIRALVDGVWGVTYGRAPTVDTIAQSASDAVAGARLSAKLGVAAPVRDWTPPAVATGEWRTPIEVDPFAVPIQQQQELMGAVGVTVERVPGSMGSFGIEWVRDMRVFASTTGALTSQELYQAYPRYQMSARYGRSVVPLRVPGFHWKSVG
jgi:thiol-disulfide isomerase/thioredoxin